MNEKLMYYLWQQSQLIDKPIVTTDDRERPSFMVGIEITTVDQTFYLQNFSWMISFG
ncbi:MAG: hypothetical protein ACJ0P9_01235 [Flavobacteriaceae bacterium]